ncbi:MAG: Wzz/FepE/Etk N-terminal domain-containing protein [Acholeplasmataceae bacterium]
MDKNEDMDQGISLSDLFGLVKANILLILLITIFTTALAGAYAFTMIETKYSSTSEMMVLIYAGTNEDATNPNYQINAGQFVETTVSLIKSDTIINELRASNIVDIPENMTNNQIKKATTVNSKVNSFIITISFTNKDKVLAQDMADAITETTVLYLGSQFNGNFIKTTNASNPIPQTTNKLLYTIVGGLIGLALSAIIILVNRFLRNTYRTKEELEKGIEIQVLGVIPEYEIKESGKK